MLSFALAAALWASPVSCDPAHGGWSCPLVAAGVRHGAGARRGGVAEPGPDPDATCLTHQICDQITIADRPARVATADVAAMAAGAMELPPPVPRTDPQGQSWVGLRTYLRIDPARRHPVSATVSAGGQTVTATGRPTKVVWDLGEATVTCAGPDAACDYTYRRSSLHLASGVYDITATLYYSVDWTCTGSCDAPGGGFGTLPAAGDTTLRVGEIQTVTRQAGGNKR